MVSLKKIGRGRRRGDAEMRKLLRRMKDAPEKSVHTLNIGGTRATMLAAQWVRVLEGWLKPKP